MNVELNTIGEDTGLLHEGVSHSEISISICTDQHIAKTRKRKKQKEKRKCLECSY